MTRWQEPATGGAPVGDARPRPAPPPPRLRRTGRDTGPALPLSVVLATLLIIAAMAAPSAQQDRPRDASRIFDPALTVPDTLKPYLDQVQPGTDAFTSERDVQAIEAGLGTLGAWLKAGGNVTPDVRDLFAANFRGARLPSSSTAAGGTGGVLSVARETPGSQERVLDASGFLAELTRWLVGAPRIGVAEFQVTVITPAGAGQVTTDVRYDIVGESGQGGAREERVGTWRLGWTLDAGRWRLVEWRTVSHVLSRATQPIFTEVTTAALGATRSFAEQLSIGLDDWMATIDGVLTRDSNGHHGVAIGDADGDGLEDLYIAQPSGLPNRLFRARGDGTFEDITDASGAGLLDDTAQPVFADIDNDGDQDLVLATSVQPLLFRNDGRGRFTVVDNAFTFERAPQGVLTGVSLADFDRDGFLDAYLCVYSYFFGAGDDKAGTPMPYYDARNGPPGVLLRNDGHGRFVDVTRQVGLDAGNDRYHFAAAWADFDEDGWPDLLVANDFGTKNLYRNLGTQGGTVKFEDVAAKAGVLDHGAGMSAAFLDYDNDGRLDIYTGNMWSASGQRVTSSASFMPDAPADVRALYQRHARGNGLFRNRGDGTFEDTTVPARAAMGRWAWSSDAIDFDSDGWQDLYVANGMLTRGGDDLDGYFWRQVVARSPLTRVKGAPYDEAWRAINQLLIRGSIASRQRNVLLHNDGRGAFDEVSGAVGLDLEQDGRGFAAIDIDRDGDPDLAVMAARQTPQLRIFRNDHPRRRRIAMRLVGTRSNRDAIGARVRVETDTLRVTRLVQASSGFLSQHSRELVIGLGDSRTIRSLIIEWPSGERQRFEDVALDARYRLTEGGTLQAEPLVDAPAPPRSSAPPMPARPLPAMTWLYEPFPAPDFSIPDATNATRSLAAFKGRPAIVLLWKSDVSEARQALDVLARGAQGLAAAGIGTLAIALDEPEAAARVTAASPVTVPVVHATRELALSWSIVHRHLFMNRQPLRLPTAMLLSAGGEIVGVYRDVVEPAQIVRDAARIEAPPAARLARALPFAGTFQLAPPQRAYLSYGRELLDEGLERLAVDALERASRANPNASTLYRLGTLLAKSGETARARGAFERALALDATLAEAHNDLGALLAQDGDLPAAIARFRRALAAMPDYPDALNNLGYALLLTGQSSEARPLYERALALQPDFPEALNNLGLLLGRSGDLVAAERNFRAALSHRPDYGEAANNLALVLVTRGAEAEAVSVLEAQLARAPQFEGTYVTLAKLHLAAGRTAEGIKVLERLLQRNPKHDLALALVREYRPK